MNSFASSYFSRGFAKIDLNHLRAFKNIQNSWQEWQGYGGTSSFRGYLPTTLCQGDMNLYRELMAISRYLYSYLHEAGMQKYFFIDIINKRAYCSKSIARMNVFSSSIHQDLPVLDSDETDFSCSVWLLIDARTDDFQRLNFIDFDPKGLLKELLPETNKAERDVYEDKLIKEYGLISPIQNVSDVGCAIAFNGTVPHRGSSDIGYRFSMDYRIYSFKNKKDMNNSLKAKQLQWMQNSSNQKITSIHS